MQIKWQNVAHTNECVMSVDALKIVLLLNYSALFGMDRIHYVNNSRVHNMVLVLFFLVPIGPFALLFFTCVLYADRISRSLNAHLSIDRTVSNEFINQISW